MNIEEKVKSLIDVLEILEKENIWVLAGPIKKTLENGNSLSEQTIDSISKFINDSINIVKDKMKQEVLEKVGEKMKRIKEMEMLEEKEQEGDIDKMLES